MTEAAQNAVPITVAQLQAEIDAGRDLFLVDLRNEDEFARWKVEGRHPVPTLNLPYFSIDEDDPAAMARVVEALPRDRELTLICAQGLATDYVAGLLRGYGFNALRQVVGGMQAYADLYVPRLVRDEPDLTIWQVNRVAKGCISYLLVSRGEAMVVDPGRHHQWYLDFAREHGYAIRHIMDTHIHADHISGGLQLAAATGAGYYVSALDAGEAGYTYTPVRDGLKFPLGTAEVEAVAVHSPGHTPGSTCLLVNRQYFVTGDTIFVTNIGRPDLGGKAAEWVHDLYDTLYRKLSTLAGDVVILPGHTSSPDEAREDGLIVATLAEVREKVDALQAGSVDDFVEMVLGHLPEAPEAYSHIVAINRGQETADAERAMELEVGRNLCHAKEKIMPV